MSLEEHSAAALEAVQAAIDAVERLRDAMDPLIGFDVDTPEGTAISAKLVEDHGGLDLETVLGESDIDLPDVFELEGLERHMQNIYYAAQEAGWDEDEDEE